MRRRQFIGLVGGAVGFAILQPSVARSVTVRPKPRIGVLWHAGSAEEEMVFLTAFRQGLADVGYVEGQNIVVEHRFPAEKPERFQAMAAELAELKMDVLVASSQPPALALQRATKTTPIVFIAAFDPVGVGLVDNLARPSGNITGLSFPDLISKRLEILKQALPDLRRVAVLINAVNQSESKVRQYAESLQDDGHKLGSVIQLVEVNGPDDLERAFSSIGERGIGVAAIADVMFFNERRRLAELAVRFGLPSILTSEEYVKVGALMSYGADGPAIFRRAAVYVDKILKGAKPSDLPVEQPTIFRLAVNLKTAKALGLTISESFLVLADKVIE